MNNGLFQQPDMSVQYPQSDPQVFNMPRGPQQVPPMGDMSVMNPDISNANNGTHMPILQGGPPQQEFPSYVGNPILDKYIHDFIGS